MDNREKEHMEIKPGDIVSGREVEQDGDITWDESKGISETVRRP